MAAAKFRAEIQTFIETGYTARRDDANGDDHAVLTQFTPVLEKSWLGKQNLVHKRGQPVSLMKNCLYRTGIEDVVEIQELDFDDDDVLVSFTGKLINANDEVMEFLIPNNTMDFSRMSVNDLKEYVITIRSLVGISLMYYGVNNAPTTRVGVGRTLAAASTENCKMIREELEATKQSLQSSQRRIMELEKQLIVRGLTRFVTRRGGYTAAARKRPASMTKRPASMTKKR